MPLQDFSFALVALAFQFRAHAHSGLTLFLPHQKFPGQLDAASALAFCPVALIYHSTLSHLQVSSFARLSVHKPKSPSQMDAAPEVQLSLSNSMFRPPCPSLLIQWGRPFEYFICFLLRLPAEAARHSKPAPNSVSVNAPAAALQRSNLCHGLSPQKFSPCPQPHGPHLSLGGSGICSNICST